MTKKIEYDDKDWRAGFDAVRVDQMLRFDALSFREKIQAMQDMAEFAERMRASVTIQSRE